MSRPGWAELTIGRMSRKIESLEQNIQALERRNEVLKQIISDICDITGLEHPDLRYERYVPVSRARQDEDNEQEETVPENREVTELRNELLSELIINSSRDFRRHGERAKLFYSTIFLLSASAYESLSRVLPLPCSKTLYRLILGPIGELQENLGDIRHVPKLLDDMKRKWGDDCLTGCLSIDACSHSSYIPPSHTSRLAESCHLDEFLGQFGTIEETKVVNKYCFVFYYQPLNPKIPCTVLFITTETSGKAQDYHTEALHVIADMAKCQGFRIVMLVSDGDNTYYKETTASFMTLRTSYPEIFQSWKRFAELGKDILNGAVAMFGADMLHLLKNMRTRMLEGRVSVNVTQPCALDMTRLKQLKIPPECFVNSDLNKMVDALPIQIFTFTNANWLFEQGFDYEAIFVLIFALFHGFFRSDCSMGDRIEMGLNVVMTLNMYMEYLDETTKAGTCQCLEFRRKKSIVTMITRKQIERIVTTTAVAIGVLLAVPSGSLVAMDRMSTHPLENFFGLLRVLCRYRHSYENISDKIAKTHFIRNARHELGITNTISKRVNIAGQRVETHGEPGKEYAPDLISVDLFAGIDGSYVCQRFKDVSHDDHYARVRAYTRRMAELTIPTANLAGEYSGQQILSRLITNSRGSGNP